MPDVTVKKGEPVDRALKRLKNKLECEGILDEVRRRRAFETPTEKTRRKARAATKRSRNRPRFNAVEFHKAKKGERSIVSQALYNADNGITTETTTTDGEPAKSE